MDREPDLTGPIECAVWLARIVWGPLRTCAACHAETGSSTAIPGLGPESEPLGLHIRCLPRALRKGSLPAPAAAADYELGVPAQRTEQARRILVTGPRAWTHVRTIPEALAQQWGDGQAILVSGACPRGADRIAEGIWTRWGGQVERRPADWAHHGRHAGFRRNADMVAAGAAVCLAFIRDHSRGATHTADLAEAAGIPTRRWHHNRHQQPSRSPETSDPPTKIDAKRPRERNRTMAGETTITIVGNLTADPELRFIPSGAAVANFTVASTPRTFDRQAGEWKDGDPLFLRCTLWRQAAENVAESLSRGSRVIVTGRLRQRSYETREGEKRTVIELDADEVGASLRYTAAKLSKPDRTTDNTGQDDQWSSAALPDEPPF